MRSSFISNIVQSAGCRNRSRCDKTSPQRHAEAVNPTKEASRAIERTSMQRQWTVSNRHSGPKEPIYPRCNPLRQKYLVLRWSRFSFLGWKCRQAPIGPQHARNRLPPRLRPVQSWHALDHPRLLQELRIQLRRNCTRQSISQWSTFAHTALSKEGSEKHILRVMTSW